MSESKRRLRRGDEGIQTEWKKQLAMNRKIEKSQKAERRQRKVMKWKTSKKQVEWKTNFRDGWAIKKKEEGRRERMEMRETRWKKANMEQDSQLKQGMGRSLQKLNRRQAMMGGMERAEDWMASMYSSIRSPCELPPLLIPGRAISSQTGASSCACIALTQIIPVHTGLPVKRLFWFTLPAESGDYSSSCFKLDPLNEGSAAWGGDVLNIILEGISIIFWHSGFVIFFSDSDYLLVLKVVAKQ